MIHFHGLPITPMAACAEGIAGRHAFLSFADPSQGDLVFSLCQGVALDNGAFPKWMEAKRQGRELTQEEKFNWKSYYEWVDSYLRHPAFQFAVVPDVIDGTEEENDILVRAWPFKSYTGAPVWHMHESIERLARLATAWPRICLGSSGKFAEIGTERWWQRMAEAMDTICDKQGRPICKIHGLRMLDVEVFSRIPLASADSTNIGRNIGLDCRWTGSYTPATKIARARVLRERIESIQSPPTWDRSMIPRIQYLFA